MGVFPARRSDTRDVGPALPPSLAPRGVQPIVVHVADAPGWDELGQLRDEISGAPQAGVLLEVGIVGGVVDDLAAELVVGQFLQGEGSPGDVLSEGLSGVVIATIKAHRVIDGEPGMPPAQEGLGELFRDEAQFQEQADRASAQALAEASGIMDGEVVELGRARCAAHGSAATARGGSPACTRAWQQALCDRRAVCRDERADRRLSMSSSARVSRRQ